MVNDFIYTKKIIFYYLHKVVNNFEYFSLIKSTLSFFNFYIFSMEAQTKSNWSSLKPRIRLIASIKLIRQSFSWITQLLKSSIWENLLLLFLLIYLTIFWFSSLFVVFISLCCISLSCIYWPNICSNKSSSISFDKCASFGLKILNFNSLSPKSVIE